MKSHIIACIFGGEKPPQEKNTREPPAYFGRFFFLGLGTRPVKTGLLTSLIAKAKDAVPLKSFQTHP